MTVGSLTIPKPSEDAKACVETVNPSNNPPLICTEKVPDFSCVGQTVALQTPANVTLTGCVTAFGILTDSYDLTIKFFKELTAGGAPVDPGYNLSGPAGAQDDNSPAELLGQTLSTQVAESECPDLGKFSITLPTETRLIVRVTDQNLEKENREKVDTYQYNYILRNSNVVDAAGNPVANTASCTPQTCFVHDDVNTISQATFNTIPLAAGVSTIAGSDDLYDNNGQGHLAGEIQDCTSEDTVQNAIVAVDATAKKLAYFNTGFGVGPYNLEDPKPQGTRTRTNADGLYSVIAISTTPGGSAVNVGAAVTPSLCGADGVCKCNEDGTNNPNWTAADAGEGETLVLGSRTVYIFPDSITIMTFDRAFYTTN